MNARHAIEPVRIPISDIPGEARITDCERISVQNTGSVFVSLRWRWGADLSAILAILAPGASIDLVAPHPQVYLQGIGLGGQLWVNGTRDGSDHGGS